MLLKILTMGVAGVLLWQILDVWRAGRKLTRLRAGDTLSRHRRGVLFIGLLTLAAVVLIETQVRMSSNPYAVNFLLFGFHLTIDVLLVVVFVVIVMRFSGLRNPRWHSTLAYTFFALYATAAGTGSVLLYRLPN